MASSSSTEGEPSSEKNHMMTPTLPLFSRPPPIQSPDHPGMATPPLYTLASVPFRWEEEPGKPRPCTALIPLPNHNNNNNEPKGLEPPPGLVAAKTPSPNTVLDGPYSFSRPKFTSSSFRFLRERRQESFDSTGSTKSPETGQIISSSSSSSVGKKKLKRKRLFPSWGQRTSKNGKKEIVVFPSTTDNDGASGFSFGFDETSEKSVDMARIRRNGSLSSLSQKPHFWASVYQGFKHVIPWKSSRKSRKEVVV